MLDLADEFRALVDGLEAARVDFAVCGGLAFAIHARPRATVDVDLLLPIEEIERAKQVARDRGYRIEPGPLVIRKDVIEIHRLSKPDPDPETGDLLTSIFWSSRRHSRRSGRRASALAGSTGPSGWYPEPVSL